MTGVDALQQALAAEHAAVYVFAVFGAETSISRSAELFRAVEAAYAAHRTRRDELTAMIRRREAEPAAAAPVYDLPTDPAQPVEVRAAALETERACTAAYAALIAEAEVQDRRWAIAALTDSAVRALSFGGVPENFPGAGDLAAPAE